jgi:hypothetical protein
MNRIPGVTARSRSVSWARWAGPSSNLPFAGRATRFRVFVTVTDRDDGSSTTLSAKRFRGAR